MDPRKYKDLFVQEAREHLATLVDGLMALESGYDRDRLDALFRAAHSMKGMSATLGYGAEAELAHALEDHLGRMRSDGQVGDGTVSLLLAAADQLTNCVDAIEHDTPRPGLERPTATLRDALSPVADAPRPATTDLSALHARFGSIAPDARHWLTLELSSTCMAPRARLLIIERTIAAFGAIAACHPDRPSWKGYDPTTHGPVTLVIEAKADVTTLLSRVSNIPDVLRVEVHEGPPAAAPAPPAPADHSPATVPRTVRVDVARVDQVLDTTGELRIAQSQLDRILDTLFVGRKPHELAEALRRLERETKSLQDQALEMRTLPVTLATGRLPRLVRDLAQRLGKDIHLEVSGEDTQVDRSVLETLGDPLMHLVKNAVDHGIEAPDARRAAGKPTHGTVRVAFRRDNTGVEVEVSDDGRGVPRARLVEKAAALGLVDRETAAAMTDRDLFRLLGTPGLSTAEQVTDVSGRGVGLDAVFTEVEHLGGTCTIRSTEGTGTTVTLRLPPTLAVVEALECVVAGEAYFIPVDTIVTSLSLAGEAVNAGSVQYPDPRATPRAETSTDGAHGDEEAPLVTLPLRELSAVLGLVRAQPRYVPSETQGARMERLAARLRGAEATTVPGPERRRAWRPQRSASTPSGPIGVVVERHGHSVCLAVDGVRAIQEIVVKTLDVPGGARFVSGATILGDGRVGLILDVPSLLAAESPGARPAAPRP